MAIPAQDLAPGIPAFDFAKVRREREAQGYTRTAFAARIGRATDTTRDYEVGRSDPPATVVAAMAMALGLDPGDLFHTVTADEFEDSGVARVSQSMAVTMLPRRRRLIRRSQT